MRARTQSSIFEERNDDRDAAGAYNMAARRWPSVKVEVVMKPNRSCGMPSTSPSAYRNKAWSVIAMYWLLSPSAYGFDVDGYSSGQSQAVVAQTAHSRGLTLDYVPALSRGAWQAYAGRNVGDKKDALPKMQFYFCGAKLAWYVRDLDFDADYVGTLERTIRALGKPTDVTTRRDPWTGPGGGLAESVDIVWGIGGERTRLSFSPELRTDAGALRNDRHASITYSIDLPGCPEAQQPNR